MTIRLVATPLSAEMRMPEPRAGGIDPALIAAFVDAPGARQAIERLADPSVLVVTTGQQPGLFTGPLYTIYKALSAAALAAELERRWQRVVVPIFWVAGDDHDFAEASQATWIAGDGGLMTGMLPPRAPDAPLTPMYRQPLGETVADVLRQLGDSLPASEFREATVDWLGRHWRPATTVAAAFAGSLAELLAPAGIICIESSHPAVKRAAAPLLLQALERARAIDSALGALAAKWRAAGREPAVGVGDGASLVMLEGELGRDRLMIDSDRFASRRGRQRYDLAELRDIARANPERLSPNVLLRPVVESALLPTVAYVAGPGELEYLEQTPPVYGALEITRQAPLPRWSGMLVEPRIERILEKFEITLPDLLEPAGPLEARLVRSQLPRGATAALDALRAAIEREYATLENAAAKVDPTLGRPVQSARNQALAGTQEVEKKLVQHLKRREDTELSQLVRARAAVSPGGKPQERVLTVAPFLARYGPSLIPELLAGIGDWYAARLDAIGLEAAARPA